MLSILQRKIAYDIMPVGKEIISPCGSPPPAAGFRVDNKGIIS